MSHPPFDPFEEAERLGVSVEYDPWCLAPDECGAWLPQFNGIFLRPGMATALERTVLAHELGHVHHDHRESSPRTEILANLWAANHLIDIELLVDAMRCSTDPQVWAAELRVTPRLLRLFTRVYEPDIARIVASSTLVRMAS